MKIIFTKNFKKSLLKLEKSIQIRIIEKIDIINKSNDSIYELNLDIKKLQPKEKWFYRLRVWKYRILFSYVNDFIKLLEVDNRDSIYL